jgi:hypothetical protein
MLHGIHSAFLPWANPEDDPVSYKKLLAGDGVWAVHKEILGWIFDGLLHTMELPPEKVTKLLDALSSAISRKSLPLKEFRTLLGKLQHASLAMHGGKSILTPLHKFVEAHKHRRILYFPKQPLILEALRDIRIVLREFNSIQHNDYIVMLRATKAFKLPLLRSRNDRCRTMRGVKTFPEREIWKEPSKREREGKRD